MSALERFLGLAASDCVNARGSYGSGEARRIHDAVRNDRWREEFSKTRLNRLYADAFMAWSRGTRARFEQVAPLLHQLRFRDAELTEEEDRQLREQYELVGGAR